jgi:hypothetical protein
LSRGYDVQAECFHVDDIRGHEGNGVDFLHRSHQSFGVAHIDSDADCTGYRQPAPAASEHPATGLGQSRNNMVSNKSGSSEKEH